MGMFRDVVFYNIYNVLCFMRFFICFSIPVKGNCAPNRRKPVGSKPRKENIAPYYGVIYVAIMYLIIYLFLIKICILYSDIYRQ